MLMNRPDSDCSRPDFQMVLEKEAEDLKTSRNLLADEAPYQTDFLQDNQDIRRGLNLIPMEPNRGVGGSSLGNRSNPIISTTSATTTNGTPPTKRDEDGMPKECG